MKTSEEKSEVYQAGLVAGYKLGQAEAIKCMKKVSFKKLAVAFEDYSLVLKEDDINVCADGVRDLLIKSIK